MTKWRNRMSEAYAEQLLELTIDLGLKAGVGEKIDFRRVNIDTTVQEKAVTFPTDSKLLECVPFKHSRNVLNQKGCWALSKVIDMSPKNLYLKQITTACLSIQTKIK
jgi:hypothetical protein